MNAICQASEPDASEYYQSVTEKVAQIGALQELTLVDAQPHEIPRLDIVSSARVGDRVEVYYPEEDEWCQGEVVKVSGNGMKHTVSRSLKQRVSSFASRAQERGRSENNVGAFSEAQPVDFPN
jgi:DNA-directed RNA polymerase subunit E'/Rpb7